MTGPIGKKGAIPCAGDYSKADLKRDVQKAKENIQSTFTFERESKQKDYAKTGYQRLDGTIFASKPPEVKKQIVETPPKFEVPKGEAYDYRNECNANLGFQKAVLDGKNNVKQGFMIDEAHLPSAMTTTAFMNRASNDNSSLSLSAKSQNWDEQFDILNANKEGESADNISYDEYSAVVKDYARESKSATAGKERDLNETVTEADEGNRKAVFKSMAGDDGKITKEEYSGFMNGLMSQGKTTEGKKGCGDVTTVTTGQFGEYVNSKLETQSFDRTNKPVQTEAATTTPTETKTQGGEPYFEVPTAEQFKSKYNLDIDPSNVSKYKEAQNGKDSGFEMELKDGTLIRSMNKEGGKIEGNKKDSNPSISYDKDNNLVVSGSTRLEVIGDKDLKEISFNDSRQISYQNESKEKNDIVNLKDTNQMTMILDEGNDKVNIFGKSRSNTFVKANADLAVNTQGAEAPKEGKEANNHLIIDSDFNERHDASQVKKEDLAETGEKTAKSILGKNETKGFWDKDQLNFRNK